MQVVEKHILRAFDSALQRIDGDFFRMGESVVKMTEDAVNAILRQDRHLALSVVEHDLDVDRMFESLRSDCFDAIIRFQPLAGDLRRVMSVEHAVGDLERIGDHAKNLAKSVIGSTAPAEPGQGSHLTELSALVIASLRNALIAMATPDSEIAAQVISGDRKIDALYAVVFDKAMVAMAGGSRPVSHWVPMMFACKSLERIGDRATNIAEEVLFMTRGMPAGATRVDFDL